MCKALGHPYFHGSIFYLFSDLVLQVHSFFLPIFFLFSNRFLLSFSYSLFLFFSLFTLFPVFFLCVFFFQLGAFDCTTVYFFYVSVDHFSCVIYSASPIHLSIALFFLYSNLSILLAHLWNSLGVDR